MKLIQKIRHNITTLSGSGHGLLTPCRRCPYAVSLMLILLMFGCRDDLSIVENSENNEADEDCIAFTMELDNSLSTRDDSFTALNNNLSFYENYIDTQDKFRIFFFTAQGDFLFGATDRIVGSLEGTGNSKSYWYVRIPMTMIVDRDNQEYDIDKIKNYLKNNPFKIAVLANWPNAGEKINPSDYDDSEGTFGSSDNPSSTLKGNPLWNWSNSVLNNQANPSDIRNINDLHHVYNDVVYANATVPSGGISRLDAYGQFLLSVTSGDDPGYYLGEPTDWVQMRDVMEGWKADKSDVTDTKRYKPNDKVNIKVSSIDGKETSFDSKETANQWIRANWNPDMNLNKDKKIYRHYQHLWYLWNFNASYQYGSWLASNTNATDDRKKAKADEIYGPNYGWDDGSKASPINPWGIEWYDRNGKAIYDWMRVSSSTTALKELKTLTDETGNQENLLIYTPISGARYITLNNLYGVYLPSAGISKGANDGQAGTFRFQARTAGTVRVRWSSANSNSASLTIQRNSNASGDTSVKTFTTSGTTAISTEAWDISVGDDSYPMYVYCSSGTAVIYSIEFIRGKYLYDTDREGKLPSADFPIPMYGVQNYSAIGDWQKGTTINLDANVSLVRALAKVEVYISKSTVKNEPPKHVYMKSMNRAARCEPMDVETPSDQIWKDPHYSVTAADQCEWYRIQQYGASFGNT